jgi:hypothetical protein
MTESLQNLLDPPILFFLLGILSVFLGSHIQIPVAITKFLSLYLLMAIGFKGGLNLTQSGLNQSFISALVGSLILASLNPLMLFHLLKKRLGAANSAAIGATYGSVSAVTFIAATNFLENLGMSFDGYMIALLAIMEAPAIILGLVLARSSGTGSSKRGFKSILHETLLNGSVFLLMGSMVIGYVAGPLGKKSVEFFILDLFKGLLGFFLLDLGIRAGNSLRKFEIPLFLIFVGILTPLLSASLALFWGILVSLSSTQTFLLMILGAGASYIAVPAALKLALPEANAGIYLTLALGITFPFNIIVGIPLYWKAVQLGGVP